MPRSPDTPYLDPHILVANFQARSTNLDGVRRFYAREGLVVFADHKTGMNAVAGEVWLRPAATRRIGSYLDLQRPAVVGFQMRRDPVQPPLPGAHPADLYRAFVQDADGTRQTPVDGDRAATLTAAYEEAGEAWPWHGSVAYEYVQRLARGQRTVGHAEVALRARRGSDDSVDVAVLINRAQDLEVATAWLNWAFSAKNRGWTITPVSLPEDLDQRLDAIRDVLRALNGGQEAQVSSPAFHRIPALLTEVAGNDEAEQEGPSERFLDIMRSSAYQTDMTSVDVVAERMGVDKAAISLITAYLKRRERAGAGSGHEDAVIALRLRQQPRHDAHLTLAWQAGKVPGQGDQLSRENWDNWSSVTWDLDRKRDFLLEAWSSVVDALAGAKVRTGGAASTQAEQRGASRYGEGARPSGRRARGLSFALSRGAAREAQQAVEGRALSNHR